MSKRVVIHITSELPDDEYTPEFIAELKEFVGDVNDSEHVIDVWATVDGEMLDI